MTIAQFVLPRLKRFKLIQNGYPGELTEVKWNAMLDDMIFALEHAAKQERPLDITKEERARIEKGLKLFAENFFDLWW